jgi:hypothetical protein
MARSNTSFVSGHLTHTYDPETEIPFTMAQLRHKTWSMPRNINQLHQMNGDLREGKRTDYRNDEERISILMLN